MSNSSSDIEEWRMEERRYRRGLGLESWVPGGTEKADGRLGERRGKVGVEVEWEDGGGVGSVVIRGCDDIESVSRGGEGWRSVELFRLGFVLCDREEEENGNSVAFSRCNSSSAGGVDG